MRKYFFIMTLLSLYVWTGCSDDSVTVVPAEIINIQSSSTPGAIQLNWDYPDNYSTIKYVRVEYYDHVLKKNIIKLVSTYTNELVVDDTRAKYGAYEFTLQVFSPTGTSGKIHTVSQVSEPSPAPVPVRYKVNLGESNLYCCHLNTVIGDGDVISSLLDGNTDTYFSTVTNLALSAAPHYLQVALPDGVSLTNFSFEYNTRNHAGGKPVQASVWVSDTGPAEGEGDDDWTENGNWTKIVNLSRDDADNPLPIGNAEKYTSDKLIPPFPFKYFRLRVELAINSINNNQLRHFFLSEFSIYGYTQPIDPEAPDVD